MKSPKPSHDPLIDFRSYNDEDLEITDDKREDVERLMKFFDDHGIDYSKFDPSKITKLDLGKSAYPNNDSYMHIPGQHNTQKWLQAISEIYGKESAGSDRVKAIRQVTSGWNIMETFDFLNWVKFHEAGDHMKYKFAQLWYENPTMGPGYFLQVKKDPEPTEDTHAATGQDIDFAKERAGADAEKRQTIEKQRNKIIGRLDSAEKLLRSPDGHTFSGKEFESLLESIYQLKKKIHMVNKISSSTRLYEDMIVREGNVLYKQGFIKAANVLYSAAQTPAASGEQAKGKPGGTEALTPASPGDPSGAGNPGAPGGLPSVGPGMPQGAPSSATPGSIANETSPTPPGIEKFLAGLNEGPNTPTDGSDAEDNLEVEDTIDVLDVDTGILVTEAQMAPPIDEPMTTSPAPANLDPSAPVKAPKPATPVAKPKEKPLDEPLEVTEDDIPKPKEQAGTSDFDAKVDAVFSNITVSDVVAKLEDLAKVFKTREIPRQLGIVDMMLDSLGLASYFPSLSEATNKALESNNYISTRVEDIISKLRGAIYTKDIDLKGGDIDRPEVAGLKGKLENDAAKEKSRKQMRKDQENIELADKGKETPEVEIEDDLAPPVTPTSKPPAPPAPRAPRTPLPPA